MKKKLLFLTLMAVFGAAASWADDEVIEITTPQELVAVSTNQNAGTGGAPYAGKTIKLMNDIDMTGIDWVPIGGGFDMKPYNAFKGTFDGNNKTISNLTCNGKTYAGLFAAITNDCVIKNLTLKDVNITGHHYAAAVAAFDGANSGSTLIENVKVIGGSIVSTPELTSSGWDNGDKVAGILAYSANKDQIKNCTVENVTISGYRDIGGIVGLGYKKYDLVLENNTVKNVKLAVNNIQNYNNYTTEEQHNVGTFLGRNIANGSESITIPTTNTSENTTTTVGVYVAKTSTNVYEPLQAAIDAANAGETVTLLGDVTPTEFQTVDGNSTYIAAVTKSLTIDGNNYTITHTKQRGIGIKGASSDNKIDVTIKNLTITSAVNAAGNIFTRGNLNSLTLDNVNLIITATSGYNQPLTISGDTQDNIPEVKITNCHFQSAPDTKCGYAILNWVPATFTIEGSKIEGWACLYAKPGTEGTTYNVNNSELISRNLNAGYSNSFGLMVTEAGNVTFNVTNTKIDASGTNNHQAVVLFSTGYGDCTGCKANLGEGNVITMQDQAYLVAHAANDNAENGGIISISGGKFDKEVPLQYCAENFVPVKNADGSYGVDTGVILDEAADNSSYDNQTTNVALLRTIHGADETGSDVFNTFAVPFAVSAETMTDVFGTYKLYEFTGATFENEILTLNFDSKTAMEAGKAYLLSVSETKTNPAFGNVAINMTAVTTGTGSKATFIPVFSNTSGIGTGQNLVFLGANNTLYFAEQAADLKGFRGYFKLAEGVAASEVSMAFDGETTGISTINNEQLTINNSSAWYTIDGRQLNAQPTQKGIYIHNGKKVVVK